MSSYRYYIREGGTETWEIRLLMKACHSSCSFRNISRLIPSHFPILWWSHLSFATPVFDSTIQENGCINFFYFQQKAKIVQKIITHNDETSTAMTQSKSLSHVTVWIEHDLAYDLKTFGGELQQDSIMLSQ